MRRGYFRRSLAGAAIAAVAVVVGLAMVSPANAQDTAQVSVVHGIPDQEVDVYVDDEVIEEGFAPGEIAGPMELPGGTYDIAVTEPGGDPADPIVSADAVEVEAGANVSLVAHLDEEGSPTLTPFVNDVDEVEAGMARLTVRHTAAAPAVDVRADGEPLVTELTNPNEETTEVPAGMVEADVVLAGGEEVVLGPAELDLTDGSVTIVYAIGSADDDTLELLTQTIDPAQSTPQGTPTATPTGTPGGTGG